MSGTEPRIIPFKRIETDEFIFEDYTDEYDIYNERLWSRYLQDQEKKEEESQ